MPTGTPKTPAERLITVTAIHKMKSTLQEVNTLLNQAGFAPMNPASFEQERLQYGPVIFAPEQRYSLREHVFHPRRRNELKEEGS
jgi:hypothetical protein